MKKDRFNINGTEEWVDILKEKVDGFAGGRPSASWEELSARMIAAKEAAGVGNGVMQQPKGRKVTRRFWSAAAAACITALVAGGIFLNQKNEAAAPTADSGAAVEEISCTAEPQEQVAVESDETVPSDMKPSVAEVPISRESRAITAEATAEIEEAAEACDSQDTANDAKPEEAVQNDKEFAEPAENVSAEPKKTYGQNDLLALADPQKKNPQRGKISVGVNGQLHRSNFNGKPGQYGAPNIPSLSKDGEFSSMTFAMAVARTEYHYAAPVSFGLSLRYDMNSGLYVETGVRFTEYLTIVTPSYARQALMYTGIPVGIGYNLFSTNNIGVYASGYYMPAKCVGGRETTNYPTNSKTRDDVPLQHSVGISAGADYVVWNMISLYAEPTLSYYFHDSNAPVTIFTENPLFVTLNVGARFNF